MPRRSKRAADPAIQLPVNGTSRPSAEPESPADYGAHAVQAQPVEAQPGEAQPIPAPNGAHAAGKVAGTPSAALAVPAAPSRAAADAGLYGVLGLDPSVPDAAILTAYRRQAARLLSNGAQNTHAMRELNTAYEVLGNPVRRAEYDRMRVSHSLSVGHPTPVRSGQKTVVRIQRRTRPRHVVQPRYAGLPDVFVVLMVVGLAVLAGVLIIPRLSINLSALNAFQSVLPQSNSSRRVIDATVTPAPASTPAPTATVRAGLAERFAGTNVSVANPTPAKNSPESVTIRLRRDGQPAANVDVYAIVGYRTTDERWPSAGTLKTDAAGLATITFNIGAATPDYPVTVRVVAQLDDQQVSWSTTFTPR